MKMKRQEEEKKEEKRKEEKRVRGTEKRMNM